jgi:hypothetical protein
MKVGVVNVWRQALAPVYISARAGRSSFAITIITRIRRTPRSARHTSAANHRIEEA